MDEDCRSNEESRKYQTEAIKLAHYAAITTWKLGGATERY